MRHNNLIFGEELCKRFGGHTDEQPYRSCTWTVDGKVYLVRCAKSSIVPRRPTSIPVDGIVFYLSDFKCWGLSDFSSKTLGRSDATSGYLNLNVA